MTALWSAPMSAMGATATSGSTMMWTRMPGQTWPGAAASFLGMWVSMMLVMMTPSLVPTLCRHRHCALAGHVAHETRATHTVSLVVMGYFFVWTVIGAVVFPVGVAAAGLAMRHPTSAVNAPISIGVVLLVAGLLQLTAWKARQLALCRELTAGDRLSSGDLRGAWRLGVRLGLHCVRSCAGLTTAALALGVMDLRVMTIVTAAITAERLAPAGLRVARVVGVAAAVAGLILLAMAMLGAIGPSKLRYI